MAGENTTISQDGIQSENSSSATKVALITGATSGLGLEFARQIDATAEADEIWLVARNATKLDEVARSLNTPVRIIPLDLSKPDAATAIADELAGHDGSVAQGKDFERRDGAALAGRGEHASITDETNREGSMNRSNPAELAPADPVHTSLTPVDRTSDLTLSDCTIESVDPADRTIERAKPARELAFLVNCAGFGRFGSWRDISDADAQAMIDLDCRAVVSLTRACLPFMSAGSRVIEVASAAAFVPLPYMNVYAASKALVLRYARALRWELHGTGITVTALCPTWVKTGFEAQARKSKGSGARAVNHLLFAQRPRTVVKRALLANRLHFAVACCSIPSLFLRLAGKVIPSCITMAGWNLIRRL